MADNEEPPKPSGPDAAFLLAAVVVGGVLFLAFSFLTFGLPLIVAAMAAAIWAYVGLMRVLDRLLVRMGSNRKKHP